jgi:phosphomannomutase
LYHGLIAGGSEVKSYGLASTDMMYAACLLDGNSGISVTASHNPKEYNGLKIVKKAPLVLGKDAGLFKIRDYVIENLENCDYEASNFDEVPTDPKDSQKLLNFFLDKVQEIGKTSEVNTKLLAQNRKLKIVIDTANAIAGVFMQKVVELYPQVEFVPLYWEIDGNFPNHSADPTKPENLKVLKEKVLELKADFGGAFDGDGDRMVIVDQNGVIFDGNFLVALMAEHFLANSDDRFNNAIIYAAPGSTCIPETIYKNSGVVVPSKMGHVYIKANLFKYNGIYGGEHSGHHYFGSFGFMDSGLLTLAVFISILVEKQVSASDLSRKLASRYHFIPETNFELSSEMTQEKILEKLKEKYSDGQFNFLDGITVFYPDWKFNIRFSNTEPLLRLNVETIGENFTLQKLAEIKQLLNLPEPV